jgi:hypothetical protein
LLSAEVVAHFVSGPELPEWYVATAGADCPDDTLDQLHRRSADPWGVDSRWYERRKRDLSSPRFPASASATRSRSAARPGH